MSRIAVLCPTRDRPDGFRALEASVVATSNLADVIGYVDADQLELYQDIPGLVTGPRIGPVAAANFIVNEYPAYDAYGLITDDAVITTPDWDAWLLDTIAHCPGRVCVVSPHHNQGNHVDMPFVSKEWVKATGWFACPDCYHYAWPIITGLIGEMSAIVHAPKDKFSIHHPSKVEMVSENKLAKDHKAFFEFVSLKLPATVERVRQAMYPA